MSHNAQFFNDKLSKLRQEIQDLSAKKEYFRRQIDPETITRVMSSMKKIIEDMTHYGALLNRIKEPNDEMRQLIAAYIRTATLTKNGEIQLELHIDSTPKDKNGYPIGIRTQTNWTKTSCATVTPRGCLFYNITSFFLFFNTILLIR